MALETVAKEVSVASVGRRFAPLLALSHLLFQAVLRVLVQHLHDVAHEIRQLLVELDLVEVLLDLVLLVEGLVVDALDVGPHYAAVVLEQPKSCVRVCGVSELFMR